MEFRKMRRSNQTLSAEECTKVLKSEKRGVLSVMGDGGYPYGVPINHYYNEADGRIYFHGGKHGHRIDALQNSNKASLCVYDEGFRKDGDWALTVKSVIVFGRLNKIEDFDKTVEISRQLSYKFTSDEKYIEDEIQTSAKRTLLLELIPEHISGKLVKEK